MLLEMCVLVKNGCDSFVCIFVEGKLGGWLGFLLVGVLVIKCMYFDQKFWVNLMDLGRPC